MTVQELSAQHLQPGDDVKYRGGCVQIYTNPVPFYTRDLSTVSGGTDSEQIHGTTAYILP